MTVKRLAPGMYEKDGTLHIVQDEFAAAVGVDEQFLEEHLERLVRKVMAELGQDEITWEETSELPPWKGYG